jgi:hypothetical protein
LLAPLDEQALCEVRMDHAVQGLFRLHGGSPARSI